MTACLSRNESSSIIKSSEEPRLALPKLEDSSKIGSRRLTLRKRSILSISDDVNLSSYNSAFLTGLFEDVAKVSDVTADENDTIVSTSDESGQDFVREFLNPAKRIRCSNSLVRSSCGSIRRSKKSFTGLLDSSLLFSKPGKCSSERLGSLHYQLNELHQVESPTSVKVILDVGNNAFPSIPPSVSSSSCYQDLTRKDDMALSTSDTPFKESYGWFVEMDECEIPHDIIDPYCHASADLAFSAPTAPKRNKLDEEIEWAKAADTVDDVLGDFF